MFKADRALRKQIDDATTVTDTTSDPIEIALIARDASSDHDAYAQIIAQIPPIKLGRTTYRAVTGGSYGLDIIGPRGGHSCLVRNLKNPALWAHNTMSGYRVKTQWYRREADGTFTAVH